jgi:hypothetical protein
MKRGQVLKKLKTAAKDAGLRYSEIELTNHTGVWVGDHRSTLARHNEIDDVTAGKFFDQFADQLGKGWWRK